MHVDAAAREISCKLVYCGPALAGKTTNLERIYLDAPPDRRGKLSSIATEGERTLFFDYMPLDLGVIQGLRVKLAIYTVPGQALYAATRRTVLQGLDGLVFVADSDPARLDECAASLAELERLLPEVRGRALRELPLVFQWNKQDLPGALSPTKLALRLNPWAKPAVSAVGTEGQGILETLRQITQLTLRDCRRQLELREPASGSAGRRLKGAARRRTSRRLRHLRAERAAEVAAGHSSEAPTLPYGPGPRVTLALSPSVAKSELRPGAPSARRRVIPPTHTPSPPRPPLHRGQPRRGGAERATPLVEERARTPRAAAPPLALTSEAPWTPPLPALTPAFSVPELPPGPPSGPSAGSRDELCPWSSVASLELRAEDPVIGRELGSWRIHAKIGEGGMGAVYLARHERLRKEVVVKVLKPELAHKASRVERFFREARLGARLKHPSLVSVQDVGTTSCGLNYMIMEYVAGENLHERLQRLGPQSPLEALRIVRALAEAMSVLHRAGVIHRDVKAENVVVTPEGEVKLIDLGLAKDLSEEDQLTLPGAMIGTPVYMAPEIGRVREVDRRVDIYALGLTWYYLLTGQPPFAGMDLQRVVLGKEPLARPRVAGGTLEPRLQNVLARMLAWHRDQRHPTMKAVLEDLERLDRGGEGLIAAPDRWALTQPKRRRPRSERRHAPQGEAPALVPAEPAAPEVSRRDPALEALRSARLSLALSLAALALALVALAL